MNKIAVWMEKWNEKLEPAKPGLKKAGNILSLIFTWIWRLRGVLLSIPVLWAALRLARMNWELLPDAVGIGLQADGLFSQMITKEMAVYGPLGITAACILMVLLTRKTLYPWLVSIMSLAIPILLWITNNFPG